MKPTDASAECATSAGARAVSTGANTVSCVAPAELAQTMPGDSSPVAPASPADGARFTIEGEIGRGGMGVVKAVRDNVLRRLVAMKVLEQDDETPAALAPRFVEEAQITGQLDHPNIVPVHDFGVAADGLELHFTMKLVEGRTLSDLFSELHARPFDSDALEHALRIILKVCDAIAFAHSRGVIHRDIKPDNVMVGSHGQVYVMDWGIAHLVSGKRIAETEVVATDRGGRDLEGTIIGTPTHMAPEQARGDIAAIGPTTDVFGLGALLYDLLTGRGPHATETPHRTIEFARERTVPPPEEHGIWPSLPPELCRITSQALETDPGDRHPNPQALADDIEKFLKGGGWFSETRFLTGELIMREGDDGDCAYIIVKGRCEAFKMVDGERVLLREMGPGDVVGELAVLAKTPRSANVVAIDDVLVKVVTADSLERELTRNAWLHRFVKTLAERFLEADERLTGRRPR